LANGEIGGRKTKHNRKKSSKHGASTAVEKKWFLKEAKRIGTIKNLNGRKKAEEGDRTANQDMKKSARKS